MFVAVYPSKTHARTVYIGDVPEQKANVQEGIFGPDAANEGSFTYAFFVDRYANDSGIAQKARLIEVNFWAINPGTITPFVAKFNGGNGARGDSYDVVAVGDPIEAAFGLNNASFTIGGENPVLDIAIGDVLVGGFHQVGLDGVVTWERGRQSEREEDYIARNNVIPNTPPGGPLTSNATFTSLDWEREFRFNLALEFIAFPDEDADGLADHWETANGLDPGDNGATDVNNGPSGDPDGDDLTNLEEFEADTNPKKADSDDDTLNDNVETGTGQFIDANNTGTDPNDADTDDDGLNDGAEIPLGTNLHVSDTDGDRLLDGSDAFPLDPKSPAQEIPEPVGQWTFEEGEELLDAHGNFPDLVLKGIAEIVEGKLDVTASRQPIRPGGWAVTDSDHGAYTGPPIRDKTLVSWLEMQKLEVLGKAGSAITIDSVSSSNYDGIVFAEREFNRWVSGSNGALRTQDWDPGFEEDELGKLIMMAITYKNLDNGLMLVTGYRNGELIGQYTTEDATSWDPGDAEIFFGIRNGNTEGGPGEIDALIENASIYNVALTPQEIERLFDSGAPGARDLIGQWTFEEDADVEDSRGNFPELSLKGDAVVQNGQLTVTGTGTDATGWAVTEDGEYEGPEITNKTLMSWLIMDSLEDGAKAGSAITIDRLSGDHFDGIIFAERETNRWMNGSSGFQRTQDFDPGFEETEAGNLVGLAVSYEHLGDGQLRVTGYRRGPGEEAQQIGTYEIGTASNWYPEDAEIFFGKRHGNVDGGPGALNAHIEEARLYDAAVSADNIVRILGTPPGDPERDEDADSLIDRWEFKYFGNLAAQHGLADPDNDGLHNGGEQTAGSDPNKADTDGDGLMDGAETNTGFFFGATNTGTDPNNPDTDGDSLIDGVETNTGNYVSAEDTGSDPHSADTDGDKLEDNVETATGILIDLGNTGTDPNKDDTDGDGIADGEELRVSVTTNPNDAGSKPPVENLAPDDPSVAEHLLLWLRTPDVNFDEQSGIWKDSSGNSNDSVPVGLGLRFLDEFKDAEFASGTLSTGQNSAVFPEEFSTLMFDDEKFDLMVSTGINGGVGLDNLTIVTVYKREIVRGFFESIIRAMGFGSVLVGSSNNNYNLGADPSIINDQGGGVDKGSFEADHPDDFFVRVSRMDRFGMNEWFNVDGTLQRVLTDKGIPYRTNNDNFYLGDLRNSPTGAFGLGEPSTAADIEVAEVAIFKEALADAQIEGISQWLQENINTKMGGPGPKRPVFEVTVLTSDPANNAATLTWRSQPDRTYVVETSVDLEVWLDAEDEVQSQGETTTVIVTDLDPNTPELYVRVREE
jgi:hypothetical protein